MERLVTVAVPTLNRPSLLQDAAASVLCQSYRSVDLVVVDNGSTQPAASALGTLRDPRLRIVRHKDTVPMQRNWQRALSEARGEFFLLLSDDDRLLPDALALLVPPLRDPAVAFAYGRYLEVDAAGERTGRAGAVAPEREPGEDFIRGKLLEGRGAMPSGVLLRTDTARAIGGFPPVGTATDLALFLALATHGMVAFVREPVVLYRRHEQALSTEAAEELVASHLELLRWVQRRETGLSDHSGIMRRYLMTWFLGKARERSAAGDRHGRAVFLEAAADVGASPSRIRSVRIQTSGPARAIGSLLRRLRGEG